MSPALAGGFLTTVPPGKSCLVIFNVTGTLEFTTEAQAGALLITPITEPEISAVHP